MNGFLNFITILKFRWLFFMKMWQKLLFNHHIIFSELFCLEGVLIETLGRCRSLDSNELMHCNTSHIADHSRGKLDQDLLGKEGCRKVEQHLSENSFPVQFLVTTFGIQDHQKTLKASQPFSRKVQKTGLYLLTHLHGE